MHVHRIRWAAIGAALAVTLGAGGLGIVNATISSGPRAVFVPITPCRLADTRPAPSTVGTRSTPLGPGEIATFMVHGSNGDCVIPPGASAISANVTITAPTSDGFLAMYPADATMPNASNLNWTADQAPTPNAVIVDLAADGSVNVFNERGTVNVIIDIVGYFEDHDHDDRYYTKAQADAQLVAKANAGDVYSKAQINGLPSSSVVAGGAVTVAGAVNTTFPRFGSAWTVTRNGVGTYTLSMPGLNPGCLSPSLPMALLSVVDIDDAGMAQISGFGSISCLSGNTNLQIETYDATGALADRGFQFVAYRPGNGQILPASVGAGPTECTVHPDTGVECV